MMVVIMTMRISQKVTQISPSSCLDSICYTAWEPESLRGVGWKAGGEMKGQEPESLLMC